MQRDRIASATFQEIWAEVVDPLYIEAASRPAEVPARPEVVLDVLALWLLHSVAARSGLASLVAEEPPWMGARVAAAARRLGLDDVADLWERAALDTLERLLVSGRHAALNEWLVEKIRQHPDAFGA